MFRGQCPDAYSTKDRDDHPQNDGKGIYDVSSYIAYRSYLWTKGCAELEEYQEYMYIAVDQEYYGVSSEFGPDQINLSIEGDNPVVHDENHGNQSSVATIKKALIIRDVTC